MNKARRRMAAGAAVDTFAGSGLTFLNELRSSSQHASVTSIDAAKLPELAKADILGLLGGGVAVGQPSRHPSTSPPRRQEPRAQAQLFLRVVQVAELAGEVGCQALPCQTFPCASSAVTSKQSSSSARMSWPKCLFFDQ